MEKVQYYKIKQDIQMPGLYLRSNFDFRTKEEWMQIFNIDENKFMELVLDDKVDDNKWFYPVGSLPIEHSDFLNELSITVAMFETILEKFKNEIASKRNGDAVLSQSLDYLEYTIGIWKFAARNK